MRTLPADVVRYAVAIEPSELAWGRLHGRLTAADTVRLAFLRRCDLGASGSGEAFALIHAQGPSEPELDAVCREIPGAGTDAAGRIWDYLALVAQSAPERADGRGPAGTGVAGTGVAGAGVAVTGMAVTGMAGTEVAGVRAAGTGVAGTEGVGAGVDACQLAAGRAEFLLARAASGRGMNWRESAALLGTDRPEEVDAAFERGEELAGVAVIGLALTHPDPAAILPRVARALERALESSDHRLRHQGIVALAHTARLHGTVDRRCLDLLRRCPRGTEADDDLWAYVPRHRLPWWLWRHRVGGWLRRLLPGG
ncbi:hypothetical protein AB0G35_09995 [Streptomyces sp. NPDC021749]|uniref:hypothetical protein n=1 Tax=Streptomyces sp. NPDC021749 TaxID=3154905 RepID=UPI0033E808D5